MFGKCFYDIPVYRLPEKKYNAGMKKDIDQKMLGEFEQDRETRADFYERNPDRKLWIENHLWKRYGGAWQFNEIVGYVRLYIDGNQILGEYWQTDAKRLVRTRRKLFVYSTHKIVPERELPFNGTNKDIYQEILDYLSDIRIELKGRLVDTSVFERIGPHVNWQAVVSGIKL